MEEEDGGEAHRIWKGGGDVFHPNDLAIRVFSLPLTTRARTNGKKERERVSHCDGTKPRRGAAASDTAELFTALGDMKGFTTSPPASQRHTETPGK
jgi:hypothetical protein